LCDPKIAELLKARLLKLLALIPPQVEQNGRLARHPHRDEDTFRRACKAPAQYHNHWIRVSILDTNSDAEQCPGF
jgi:hypothetical protein